MMIPLLDAMQLCKRMGRPMTQVGLRNAASNHGFAESKPVGPNYRIWMFDREKLIAYIEQAKKGVPDGWITLKQAAAEMDVAVHRLYTLVDKKIVETARYGAGKGIIHVRREDIIQHAERIKASQ